MRRLHVAILDEELPYPLTSGKRIRTFHLLSRLALRHRLTYLCHRNTDPVEAAEAQAKLERIGITCRVIDRPVPRKSGAGFAWRLARNLLSPLPYTVASHTSAALCQAAHTLAQRESVDLWHCEWTPYAQTLRQSRQPEIATTPWVVMAHNVESLIWQRYAETESHPLKRWYIRRQFGKYRDFEHWAYTQATQAIAVSLPDAARMRDDFGSTRVSVVENGVDVAYFQPAQIERDPYRILFLGSLDWRPNLDAVRLLLEHIFPAVRASEPRATLVLVGRHPPAWLRQLVANQLQVELYGDVADVRPYLARTGLLAVPLRIGGGSRLKILEALAAGLPVVSTRIGAEGLQLQPNEHFTQTETAETMAPALLQAMRNPRSMAIQAQRGRQRVLDLYDWDPLARRLEAIWLDCVSSATLPHAA